MLQSSNNIFTTQTRSKRKVGYESEEDDDHILKKMTLAVHGMGVSAAVPDVPVDVQMHEK